MFGLFDNNRSDYSDGLGADNAAWKIAQSDRTVRSIEPIKGFKAVSQRQLDAFAKSLKERKEMSTRWAKWLKLHNAWEQIDADDTQQLQAYYAELSKTLGQKLSAVGTKRIALEHNRLARAQIEHGVDQAKAQTDRAISELRNQQNGIAKERGWLQ